MENVDSSYHHTEEGKTLSVRDIRTEHFTLLTRGLEKTVREI